MDGRQTPARCRGFENTLERDDFSSNRHPALSFCLSMISGQTLRVCPEGKPVATFPGSCCRLKPDRALRPQRGEQDKWLASRCVNCSTTRRNTTTACPPSTSTTWSRRSPPRHGPPAV